MPAGSRSWSTRSTARRPSTLPIPRSRTASTTARPARTPYQEALHAEWQAHFGIAGSEIVLHILKQYQHDPLIMRAVDILEDVL